MSTARYYLLVLINCACCLFAGCATVIEGPTDRVRYEGGPGVLAFYDTTGKQIPSDHEYIQEEGLHFNFIELDKSESEHVIIARHGDLIQRDTLRRKFGYGWLVPNALTVYPFPAFVGIDVLTASIYAFPPPGLSLRKGDTTGLQTPVSLTLVEAEERRRASHKYLLKLHAGFPMPSLDDLGLPPAYGILGGYHFGNELWTTLGYNYSSKLEQRLGYAQRIYGTEVHRVEATVQYAPIKYAYVLAGLGFDHIIFQLASRPDDNEKRFGRNVISGSFGAGLYFGSLFMEVRRNIALAGIETPEGPGHQTRFTHIRAGLVFRLQSMF